jgi:hypothetical protein
LVEAQEFDVDQIEIFKRKMDEYYGVGPNALDPYFEHQLIDFNLGHAQMLEDNLDLLKLQDRETLDRVINKLHDVKHAFELQGTEIQQYYSQLNGKYFPRQRVELASI